MRLVPRPADSRPRQEALSARHVLAGWLSLIAGDHGWNAETVAHRADSDTEPARAILDGDVIVTPAPVLDSVLRRLERRPTWRRRFFPTARREHDGVEHRRASAAC